MVKVLTVWNFPHKHAKISIMASEDMSYMHLHAHINISLFPNKSVNPVLALWHLLEYVNCFLNLFNCDCKCDLYCILKIMAVK